MASREKRPLAPSKSKQKANNDSGLLSNEIKHRKGKPLSNLKQQQLARDILEAVATGSQLPPKLEATLPRKKVLKNLKRKQKLRVAKANLIKSKVTRKVANNRSLCRLASDIKKGVRPKRVKLSEVDTIKTVDVSSRISENHINDLESESAGTEIAKSSKNNSRSKKTKLEDTQDKDTDTVAGSSSKSATKVNRRGRNLDSPDSPTRSIKPSKFSGFKRNNIVKSIEGDIKGTKGRKSKEADLTCGTRSSSGIDTKFSKTTLDSKNSIDLTIDEVIASMLSDSEIDNQQGTTNKIEGKITRSRKMLVEENIVPDIEIKKEPDTEETKITSDGEYAETESFQPAIQLRKRSSNVPIERAQRSLRNGKLRQLSDSSISTDLDLKRRKRLNSDDPVCSEVSVDLITDSNVDTESCFSESSVNDSQAILAAKEEPCVTKEEKSFDEGAQAVSEIENNNNSDRIEVGPTLRSKTKAKSTENETKGDDLKVEYIRMSTKTTGPEEEFKKSGTPEQLRKENVLGKFADKSKARRSSLNIDMKKTVNSFYGTEKTDGSPKSQIDQMIENIKLTIAKSIESKIFGPEKTLGLNKNFEVPKIEEIVAPLSTESQKLGLEENVDEDNKPANAKNEIKSDSSENSVPKVADTAKEIEKLVMGDIELAETHSQNVQETEPPDIQGTNDARNVSETATHSLDNNETAIKPEETQKNSEATIEGFSKYLDELNEHQSKATTDESKRAAVRKSPRIIDKGSTESTNVEAGKKFNRLSIKTPQKASESSEESSTEDARQSLPSDASLANDEASKTDPIESSATPKQSQGKSEDTEMRTERSNTSEHDASFNISLDSEDMETLESISQEVERLVAGDQANGQLESTSNESLRNEQTPETKSSTELAEKDDRGSSWEDKGPTDAEAASSSESLEPNDVKETDSRILTPEAVHSTKKHKHNSHISTNPDCDSNSENNFTPSVVRDSIEETKEEANDKGDEGKESSSDDVACPGPIDKDANSSKTVESEHVESPTGAAEEETEKKPVTERNIEDQKSALVGEEKRRVLRTRDRTRKTDKRQSGPGSVDTVVKIKTEDTREDKADEAPEEKQQPAGSRNPSEEMDEAQNTAEFDPTTDLLESQARTRRSREMKKRKEEQSLAAMKTKRAKRELRKSDQRNKEETLLDNEVAKINENNRSSFLSKYANGAERTENFRGFSEGGRGDLLGKLKTESSNVRSKSENDIGTATERGKADSDSPLSENLSVNPLSKEADGIDMLDSECKEAVKTPETSQKDSDEASTSSESSCSANATPKILETPEDKAKKESILRLLGLESLEKAAERLNHQKAKKEQYTGTLKTVIRVTKEKEKDKRRSRSPLKMVLKQGRGDGEGDSPEFYTIQKEFGTSGLGDSSSGANRKFTTNHRHSCDEDNEDAAPKDRQSLVIPEKSSSFSIHPGRLCADVCCYCFGKFGSLDTPMHLAQMKSDERRKKILNIERHLTKDSCLCDACYRHVDRKANTSPTNMQAKPQKQHRQLMVSKCTVRECRDQARHHVKRRWLLKIKVALQSQVDIDWESSQHTSMSFCKTHYKKIERFLACALCKRRLARNHTHQLANAETKELNQLLGQQGIPVVLAAGTFVCKLCRYFTQVQLKYKDVENMGTNHRSFFKSYRKRILHFHDIVVLENEEEDSSQNQSKDKEKRKKSKCAQPKGVTSKSPDGSAMMNSASEKSTPEPAKNEGTNSETDNENRNSKGNSNDENNVPTNVQYLSIESTVEKLKKRKLLDMHSYTTNDTTISCDGSNEVVEIFAMDKEVTLTRLPKRPRTSNDITPVVQRLGANPSISVRTLFPGEEEMNLHANIEFTNVREITPQGWEKCATMIQYDRDTKLLWQELQRPYGNQSSFLRHLILLEKYYRSGDLVLAPNASRNAINYSTSVQNRLISYEGPEKMDEPIMEPIASEYHNSRRLSGGYMLEQRCERQSLPSTSSTAKTSNVAQQQQPAKGSPPRVLKLNPGVSIIKKPPPSLQRLSLPSTSTTNTTSNGTARRKDGQKTMPVTSGGKVFQLSEPEYKRLQTLKKQKQMLTEKQPISPNTSGSSSSPPNFKSATHYQKAQIAAHTQFQKHLRMQQEMLNRQSRSDFEPLICDVRSLMNENTPTPNLLHNLNLPKSIQVTTKPPNPIPILPKIPKSLTVIPQTVTRPTEK